MQEQEPLVNDILSSIRQILSNKIDEGVSTMPDSVNSVVKTQTAQAGCEAPVDETANVFMLTRAMRLPDEETSQSVPLPPPPIQSVKPAENDEKLGWISSQQFDASEQKKQETIPDDDYIFSDWQSPVGMVNEPLAPVSVETSIKQDQKNPSAVDENMPLSEVDVKRMVQTWLDKNLPTLVERIVTEEVRRIFNKH